MRTRLGPEALIQRFIGNRVAPRKAEGLDPLVGHPDCFQNAFVRIACYSRDCVLLLHSGILSRTVKYHGMAKRCMFSMKREKIKTNFKAFAKLKAVESRLCSSRMEKKVQVRKKNA